MGGGPDFQSIAESITSAIGIAKALISADRAFDKAELKLKLADLMVDLADARTQMAEMQDVVYRMGDEITELGKKLKFAGSMVYRAPYYVSVVDERADGPYCANCWDAKKSAIRLYEWSAGPWICNTCKSKVHDGISRDPPPDQLEPPF
jgi:hypothetical protein